MKTKPFSYDITKIPSTNHIEPDEVGIEMTLVVAVTYDEGLIVKSDSLGVDTKPAGESEFVVTNILETEKKIFRFTPTAIISAAGSYKISALNFMEAYAALYARCHNDNFNDAVSEAHRTIAPLAAGASPKGELLIAGYDKKRDSFRIVSIKFEDRRVNAPEECYGYHAIGGKEITDHLLRVGKVGSLGADAIDHSQQYVDLTTDNLFLATSIEEQKLMKKYPQFPWHIAGKLQKWVITSNGATEATSEISLPRRIDINDRQSKDLQKSVVAQQS